MKILIKDVKIKDRRREDLGDIAGLAESIKNYGLIHPIVIDDKNTLVVGERRLEAHKLLGEKFIEARSFGELSVVERHEIEIEENLRRKNLTPFERSKHTAELAEAAKKAAEEEKREQDLSPEFGDKLKREKGRPKEGSSTAGASERTGIPEQTIRDAEAHVAAAEKYPFLQSPGWAQKPALEMAKILDEIGKTDVKHLLGYVGNGFGGSPGTIRKFFTTWRDASLETRETIRRRLNGSLEERHRTVSLMSDCSPNPDGLYFDSSEIERTAKQLIEKYKNHPLMPKWKKVVQEIKAFVVEASDHNKVVIAEQREEIFA